MREVEGRGEDTLNCFVGTDSHNPHLPTLNTSDTLLYHSVLQGKKDRTLTFYPWSHYHVM